MQAARRLYVYLLSGISLGVLVAGLGLLLGVLFDQLGLTAGQVIGGADHARREQLTLATALTVVSLPVWLIHWYFAERSVRPGQPAAEVERSSELRATYFAVVLGLLLLTAAGSAMTVVESVVLAVAGESVSFRDPGGSLATVIVAGVAFGYHARVRLRDIDRGPMQGAAVVLPRLYVYVAALGGLLILGFGIIRLAEVAGRLLLGEPGAVMAGGTWWAEPLAGAIAWIAVGGTIWGIHWVHLDRALASAGWRGVSHRSTRLRPAYFVAVIVVSTIAVISFLGQAGRDTIEWLLGTAQLSGVQLVGSVVVAVVSAAVFATAWAIHAGWLRREAADARSTSVETARRLRGYPPALVGLAFGATALAWLLGIVIDSLFGGQRAAIAGGMRETELAQFVPFVLLGAGVWLWQWWDVSRGWASSPQVEALSTVRRTYLLLVVGASVIAGIGSLGVILYRLFGTLFGLDMTGNTVSELSTPVGVLLVVVALAAYHTVALRRDDAVRREVQPSPPETAAEPASVILRLSVQSGADLDQQLQRLRNALMAGALLEEVAPVPDREQESAPDSGLAEPQPSPAPRG